MFREPPGSYGICQICFWEDDLVQLRWPDWEGGANSPSLIQAQLNYARHGAMEDRFVANVRPARDDEPIEPGWRVIEPALDNFEPKGTKTTNYPEDLAALYWWRPTFWRNGSQGALR